jgi:hypothetical protein
MYSRDFLTIAAQGDIKLTQEDQSLEKDSPIIPRQPRLEERIAIWHGVVNLHLFHAYVQVISPSFT